MMFLNICWKDGKVWYIMDSAWIASWLAYVKFDRKVAPAPGPCKNNRLIIYDYHDKKYIGRPGLIMARKDFGGDYRRVSKEVWDLFCSYYPNSGPSITMVFVLSEKNEKGIYDTSKWTIIDPPSPPEDAMEKKPKKKLINFNLKLHRDANQKQESQPTTDPNARDSTSLLSKSDGQQGTIGTLPDSSGTVIPIPIGIDGDRAPDSDDEMDSAPSNSFAGKTKNTPKVVGLNLNYSKVSNDKSNGRKESTVKSDAVSPFLHPLSYYELANNISLFFQIIQSIYLSKD